MQKSLLADMILILILITCALTLRIPIVAERKIMPAGDVFNFQSITENLLQGTYPKNENRLPGYPLLILATRPLPVDPIQAAIGINIAVSSFTLAALYALCRSLFVPRFIAFSILAISLFDPLLTLSAVRPLADATFILFLALSLLVLVRIFNSAAPSKSALVLAGVLIAATMMTRFEGVAIGVLTLPFLLLKHSWQTVVRAATVPLIIGLLWIPMHIEIHGELMGGYLAAFKNENSDFGNADAAPQKLLTLISSAGWGSAWLIPADELQQEKPNEAFTRVVGSGSWLLSVCAVVGIGWIIIRNRMAAIPIFTAVIGYSAVLIWWFLYSRFVTPLVPIYYITAACGAYVLFLIIQRALPRWLRPGSPIVMGAFLGFILWTTAISQYSHGLGRSWENNGKGYALLEAVRQTSKLNRPTVYWTEEHLFAALYLKDDGFYLNRYPDASLNELYDLVQKQQVQYLVQYGQDERLPALRQLLLERNHISQSENYRSFVWSDASEEFITVDTLVWR